MELKLKKKKTAEFFVIFFQHSCIVFQSRIASQSIKGVNDDSFSASKDDSVAKNTTDTSEKVDEMKPREQIIDMSLASQDRISEPNNNETMNGTAGSISLSDFRNMYMKIYF